MLTNLAASPIFSSSSVDSFVHAGKRIRLVSDSIVNIHADVLVSSDDNYLTMGGGVSAALRFAGGREVYEEARTHIPAQIGSVVVTSPGRLPVRHIFHAIVIDFDTKQWPDVDIVRKATASCLKAADERECHSIALPALGTGAGMFASQAAAEAMLETILELAPVLKYVEEIILVLYRQDTLIEFLRYGILGRVQAEYRARLAELQQASSRMAEQLRQESPYRDLPFPVAVGRRMIDVFSNPHSRFTAALDCAEAILRYCGAVAAANQSRVHKGQSQIIQEFRSSDDDLLPQMMKTFRQSLPQQSPEIALPAAGAAPPIMEEFRRALSMGSWGNLVEKYVPKKFKYDGSMQDFAVMKPLQDYYWQNQQRFTNLIHIRNTHKGHGATHNADVYQGLFKQVMDDLEPLIAGIKWAAQFPLIYVETTCIGDEDSESFYTYDIQRITGDNILFRRDTLRSQSLRLTNGRLYLLAEDGSAALSLSPFLVFASCPLCQTQETFFLEVIDDKARRHYHTFRSNHRWNE